MNLNLSCRMKGEETINYSFTSFRWFKDGSPLVNSSNQNLQLNTLSESDTGDYKCIANLNSNYLSLGFATKTSNIFKLYFIQSKLRMFEF